MAGYADKIIVAHSDIVRGYFVVTLPSVVKVVVIIVNIAAHPLFVVVLLLQRGCVRQIVRGYA